jgi:hypothetical protein
MLPSSTCHFSQISCFEKLISLCCLCIGLSVYLSVYSSCLSICLCIPHNLCKEAYEIALLSVYPSCLSMSLCITHNLCKDAYEIALLSVYPFVCPCLCVFPTIFVRRLMRSPCCRCVCFPLHISYGRNDIATYCHAMSLFACVLPCASVVSKESSSQNLCLWRDWP